VPVAGISPDVLTGGRSKYHIECSDPVKSSLDVVGEGGLALWATEIEFPTSVEDYVLFIYLSIVIVMVFALLFV
jgi:hypothetical protein